MIEMQAWYVRALSARVWHVMKAVMPRWLIIAFGACLVIPGPFDEMAALLTALVFVICRWSKAKAAWKAYAS